MRESQGGGIEPADWLAVDVRSGPGRSLKAPLFAALGIKRGQRPRVLDGTAGYGLDTWLIAAAGCQVTAVERSPVVFAALLASWSRARAAEPDIADRIELVEGETAAVLAGRTDIEAVYLDPMFAAERKAAQKKAMKLLREVVGDDADADELFEPAMRAATRRVVVKRARRAPVLGGRAPDLTFEGKGLRFDVYLKKGSGVSGQASEAAP